MIVLWVKQVSIQVSILASASEAASLTKVQRQSWGSQVAVEKNSIVSE